MEETKFQYSVLAILGIIVLILIIGFSAKKTKTDAGTSIALFGKVIYRNKALKESLKNSETEERETIEAEHGLPKKAA